MLRIPTDDPNAMNVETLACDLSHEFSWFALLRPYERIAAAAATTTTTTTSTITKRTFVLFVLCYKYYTHCRHTATVVYFFTFSLLLLLLLLSHRAALDVHLILLVLCLQQYFSAQIISSRNKLPASTCVH